MDKELKELMQISIINENRTLSEMISDIVPNAIEKVVCLENNIEREIPKNQEFRIVVYKKENPLIRFFKGIKFAFKKIKILGDSREINLVKNNILNK